MDEKNLEQPFVEKKINPLHIIDSFNFHHKTQTVTMMLIGSVLLLSGSYFILGHSIKNTQKISTPIHLLPTATTIPSPTASPSATPIQNITDIPLRYVTPTPHR